MTRCEFFMENDRITGFSVSGHSGYAEAGSDIVCAAISAVVTMAEATINDVCGAKAKVVKNGKGKKIYVLRYKAKKNEKKKIGHRQPYTKVEITKIAL